MTTIETLRHSYFSDSASFEQDDLGNSILFDLFSSDPTEPALLLADLTLLLTAWKRSESSDYRDSPATAWISPDDLAIVLLTPDHLSLSVFISHRELERALEATHESYLE
jgi:hypothetical protein